MNRKLYQSSQKSFGVAGKIRTTAAMLSILLLASLLLSGCQLRRGGAVGQNPAGTSGGQHRHVEAPTRNRRARRAHPQTAPNRYAYRGRRKSRAAQAEQAARDYFAALEGGRCGTGRGPAFHASA